MPSLVYEQGGIGSCTANALCAAVAFASRPSRQAFEPSRLFLYYAERARNGEAALDAGATFADGLAALSSVGVCGEARWPYVEDNYDLAPPGGAYEEAAAHRYLGHEVTLDLQEVKRLLAAGYPVAIGLEITEAIESDAVARGECLRYSGPESDATIGGHAMCAVGYDEALQHLIVRNSWGPDWSQGGHCHISYEYLEHYLCECAVVTRSASDPDVT